MATIKLLVDGGAMKPGPAIAQQLGPMGINIGKVISEVNTATSMFKGMQVPVNLDVDAKTKSFTVKVLTPSVSALIKKEAGIELASGERKKYQVGNISIEQLISVTNQKFSSMLAKDFRSALKSVIGSCMTMGILIESQDPKEFLQNLEAGKYDKEIKAKKTDTDPKKLKELKEYFQQVQTKQQAAKKAEEEAKAAEEAAKAAAATAKPAEGAAAATPAAATPAATAKPAAAAKK
ncbi:50S ribosomal protein L11 [uncultured archaeon]|nr:50S ribosomal protein L11 [uncultured archaeon]